MRDPFKPKGAVAQWRMIFDYMKDREVGELVTYDQLTEALDRDFRHDRGPFYRARREMEAERKRTLVVVTGKGYQVANVQEHEREVIKHHQKGRRQLRRSKVLVESADRRLMSHAERQRFDSLQLQISQHERAIGHLARRQKATEDVLAVVQTNQDRLREDHERLIAALRRRGVEIPEEIVVDPETGEVVEEK